MSKIKHTTVVLTGKAQEVKIDLAPVFGLKNILSAGLILFGKLSSSEREKVIQEANNILPQQAPEPVSMEPDASKAAREDEVAAARSAVKKKRKRGQRPSRVG